MPKPYSSCGTKIKTRQIDQGTKPLRVLLSGQHALVRAGIRALLERIDEVKVAEAGDSQQILASIKQFNPDVVLLEVSTPGLTGLQLLKEVVEKFSSKRVIALTRHETEEHAVQAFRLGAAGFISKSASSTELELAVKTVANGECYLPPELSKQDILKYLDDPEAFPPQLTARQYEVLKMIAEGVATKKIARRLGISVKTVETHRSQIMQRLNIYDIAGLVRYALRTGLVKLDE
jgi:DNA-binding NarL/FixJ family response regulator